MLPRLVLPLLPILLPAGLLLLHALLHALR
jgi:hypothetical protein